MTETLKRPGPKPISGQAMTATERTQRRRERLAREQAEAEAREQYLRRIARVASTKLLEEQRATLFYRVAAEAHGAAEEAILTDELDRVSARALHQPFR